MAIPVLAALAGVVIISGQLQSIVSLYPPLWTAYQKKALSSWPNVNPTVIELINLRFRKQIQESEYLLRCEEFGINNEYASKLFISATNMLTAADYITLWRRMELAEPDCDDKLRQLQFSDSDIKLLKRVTLYFPNPGDIVRFAVREAYSPEIAEKFGQYDDLPAKFLEEAAKAGLPADIAKQYWAAHWELPSPSMGFEMFQRRIIDEPTLHMLLRSLDVMPFWRDKLTKLSYNPMTRVDVRRMFSMGVMTEDEVNNAYLDIGYSPENAQRLTDFTTMDTTKEVENLPLTAVRNAYMKGLITIEQLKAYLKDLRYTERVIAFWASIIEYEKKNKENEDFVDEVKAQYKNGMIDITEARKIMENADLPASFITHEITLMMKNLSVKAKLPTRSDLTDWLTKHVIGQDIFVSRMIKLGYSREDTEYYLSEIAKSVDVTKQKFLPIKTYETWYANGLITEQRFRTILVAMGTSKEDIETEISNLKSKAEPEA